MSGRLKYILFLILLLFLTSNKVFHNNPILLKIKQQFVSYIQKNPQEKIYLHIDKTQTTIGETIWFKVYLVDAWWHIETTLSSLVHVELIDPKNRILDTKHIHVSRERATGDFLIPMDGTPGTYLIRAYTNYMRNFDEALFYHQQIQVWNPYKQSENTERMNPRMGADTITNNHSDSIQIQFFPEGGDLVNGILSTVAFKIIGSKGKCNEENTIIVDQEGKFITHAISNKQGLGIFTFYPQSGYSYQAEFTCEGEVSKFKLPDALQEGYVLKVNQQVGGKTTVRMQTNIKDGLNGAFVIGQMRGQIYFTFEGNSNAMELLGQVSTTELPDGICQFTLFTPQGEPVCERLIYIRNPGNQITVDLHTDKQVYTPREQIKVELEIKDDNSEKISSNISCAVIDLTLSRNDYTGVNIRSYLLLSSELNGLIDHSLFFNDPVDLRNRQIQDLLLMTYGWRRFVWKKILDEEITTKRLYMPESGFTIEGMITRAENREKTIPAQVFISTIGHDGFQMQDQTTGPDGIFRFRNLFFTDTTHIILQANIFNEKKSDKKNKKNQTNNIQNTGPQGNRNVSILLQEQVPPEKNLFFQKQVFFNLPVVDYLADRRMANRIDSSYRTDWQIELKEIVIKGRKTVKPKEDNFRNYYGTPNNRIILDSLPGLAGNMTIFDILRGRVSGVQVYGSGFTQYAVIRGSSSLTGDNSAQIFLDGLALENEDAASLNIYDIAAIDVFKGPSTAIFGVRGGNGVIVIHTRTSSGTTQYFEEAPAGILRYKHPGYYKAREFYSPDYNKSRPEHKLPDLRSTLFWNPELKSTSLGKYSFSFYTGDKKSDYKIMLEGITADGRPIYKEAMIHVR